MESRGLAAVSSIPDLPVGIVVDCRPQSKPRSNETAEIRQQIAGSMDEHKRQQIFGSCPDYAKRDSAHRQDDDRIGNALALGIALGTK
jgi:hypothetical protein